MHNASHGGSVHNALLSAISTDAHSTGCLLPGASHWNTAAHVLAILLGTFCSVTCQAHVSAAVAIDHPTCMFFLHIHTHTHTYTHKHTRTHTSTHTYTNTNTQVSAALAARYRANRDTGKAHDMKGSGVMHPLSSEVVKVCLPGGQIKVCVCLC